MKKPEIRYGKPCPTCGRSLYRLIKSRLLKCYECRREWPESELTHKPSGSGVIAGPVRIGRGWVWGAGL